jgi:hypothetical protein
MVERDGGTQHRAATDARTARICRLLEEAAREGERALVLLAQARAVYGQEGTGDAARSLRLRTLARQLSDVERQGRRRIDQARSLLRPPARLRLVRP